MERRVLLAFLLSLLVLLVYQSLVVPPPRPDAAGDGAPDASSPALPSGAGALASSGTVAAPAPTAADESAESAAAVEITPVVADTEPRDIVVEGERLRAVFRNRGASPIHWELKEHLDPRTGRPVDLVPPALPPDELPPFSLVFADPELTARASSGLFRPGTTSLTLDDRLRTLSFAFEDSSGFRVSKEYAFEPSGHGYVVHFRASASLGGAVLAPEIEWGPALGGVESSSSGMVYREGPRGVIFGRLVGVDGIEDEGMTRPTGSDVTAQASYRGQIGFAGVDNHYFAAVALTGRREAEISYRYLPLPPLEVEGDPRNLMAFRLRPPGDGIDLPFYVGPKEFDLLEQVDPALIRSIDFGWMSPLVVPLHRSLTLVHEYVGNWGWAIIVLTILVNLVIAPLRHLSVVSMRKMQEVGPEIKAIQERYKHLKATDPEKQKMNREVMELYRERGVNPASGCLPMLLTMHVLFAFFGLLRSAAEIRGEPFVGWITDLSVEDPLYITPVVMGASMFLQQKMTPTPSAEPLQQKLLMLMPVGFTFMFVWAPSGLVLYWLTSNLVAIAQTVVTNRMIGPPRIRTVRPSAERRVKTPGGDPDAGQPESPAPAPAERRVKRSGGDQAAGQSRHAARPAAERRRKRRGRASGSGSKAKAK